MEKIKTEVFEGNRLHDNCTYSEEFPEFMLVGSNCTTGQRSMIPVGPQMLSRHLLLLGGIGTGKSNAFNFLISNILYMKTQKDVVIIFDTKGDYYKEFYIARTIYSDKIERTSQPFFPNAAKDLTSALLLHLARSEKLANRRNNASLRAIFNSFSVPEMKKILDCHKDLKAMKAYIEDEKSGQTLGVVSEMQQAVRELFVGNFAKKGTLSMRQLVRRKQGQVIFIEYDLGLGGILTPIYKLLIDLAIKEALCRTSNEGNVYFFIDEFRLLPHLEHIDDGVNFGRSLGAKFFFGIQNIDQIAHAYGKDLAQSILSGFGTKICFRVNDSESREYIKNLFGRNTKMNSFISSVTNRGIVEQIRDSNVVEDSDLNSLGLGQAIIGAPGCEPFRFQFKRYN